MTRRWPERGSRSPELSPVGDVVSGLLAERVLAQGITVGRLAKRWVEVVGALLAEETAPVRFEGGVLTVAASTGAWSAQVRFLAEEVRNGANRTLGADIVTRVRVVVRTDV
jgi:predicted nucleic acid-binding Zn ribbon protein